MPETGKKTVKILGWFLVSTILLLIAALVVLSFTMPRFAEKHLSTYVSEKSGGLYKLSFDDVNIHWIPFSLGIENLNFHPEEKMTATKRTKMLNQTLYSFRASEIQFRKIKILTFLKTGNFHTKNLRIIDPELELSGEEIFQNDSTQKVKTFFKELQPLFQERLKKIQIDKIEFINAQYGLSQTIGERGHFSKAEQISVDILNFRTDSTLVFGEQRLFQTDDVLIRMINFNNKLGDSLHVLKIDTLKYSLKTSDIGASGFHLTASNMTPDRNRYDVHVPRMYLKSKNIANLNFSDSLNIRFLKFEQPKIKFYQKENPETIKVEDIDNFDLYTLVENDFRKIEIDTFLLSGANTEIFRQPDLEKYQHRFNRLNIRLNGFVLDSASAKNQQKLLHADDLEMSVSGYHLRLEDNQHDFRADSLFVSTFTNSLGAKKIAVLPVSSAKVKPRTEINISGEALEIENVNLKELYHTRILPTSKVEILAPNVNLRYHREIKRLEKQKEAGLLFDLVSAYLKGVYSNLVFIDNGILNIQNLYNNNVQGFFETQFSFSLTDFSLDSASVQQTDKFFYATGFDLRFSDYEMKLVDDLHKLDVDSIYISSLNQNVQINNLLLQPAIPNISEKEMRDHNRSELYKVFIPKINLHRIDLRNAFFRNKLKMNNFTVYNPEIYFENFGSLRDDKEKKELAEFYQLLFNYIEDFEIDKITIPDGKITWINHTRRGKTTSFDNEFSATLENFKLNENQLDKKRLFFSDNFDVSVKDQLFQLSDSVHILRAGEINLSTAKSGIVIRNAVLYPAIASPKYNSLSTTFQVSIPELKISDLNFKEAYYTRNLKLSRLDINNAKFQIYSKPKAIKSLELKKYAIPLPAFVNSLELKEFKVNNGEVMTYETQGINHKAISNFKIDLSMPDMKIGNNSSQQPELRTSNFELDISDFYAPVGTHQINAGKISFNRLQKKIGIKNLEVEPLSDAIKINRFTINAPEISFTGFDFNKALESTNFLFDEISIRNPQVKVELNDSVKGDKFDFVQTLDLFPYTEPYVDRIEVKNLNLNNANVNFNWFKKQLIDKEINLKFNDILIAENQPATNLLNSREFEISTTNLRTTDKNDLYEFTAETFTYNSARHSIMLENLNVNPLVEKDDLPRKKGFQTDVVNVGIDYIELKQINEKRWLKDNILEAKTLKIGPANADIFRNKRYRFNHAQRPPWPQDLIKNIKQPFVFDSVILAPSELKYSELTAIADTPGFIEFNDLQFKAGKISNIEVISNRIKNLKIDAAAKLYNQATLSVNFNFDLTANNYYHTVSGSLEEMPVLPLNNIVEKSAPIKIESGKINRFDFNLVLKENVASGELFFGYEDFRISLLNYSDDEIKKSKFATFWANKMVLNSETKKGEKLEPVQLYYERDNERSIINYWWKTIYSGAQKKLGIEPENK